MAIVDPFFRHELRPEVEIIIASRAITVGHSSDVQGVVNVAGDRDLVIFGDEVTLTGTIPTQQPGAKPGDPTLQPGQFLNGAAGASITILARVLSGEATLDT